MKLKFTIAFLLAAVCVAFLVNFLIPKDLSVANLKGVAKFIEPEAYYVTGMVYDLQNTEAGQRVALLPRQLKTGKYGSKPKFSRHEGFVGPENCQECHADYYKGFIQTAHYKTSAFPSDSSILGSFSNGENVMETKQAGFQYEMTKQGKEFFQKLLVEQDGNIYEHKRRFDIVTGSGSVGQTYLYWEEDGLFQLPVSWLAKGGWVNSPGYPDGLANFARPIREECMTCHATMVEFAERHVGIIDRENMILGVSCERCHGPAEAHVNFHRANPDSKEGAKFIVHPNDLSRDRMNDICAQCHAGGSKSIQSPFNFRPGDSIADFKRFSKDPTSGGGVHTANQYPRLIKSKCYSNSDSMNCATCHNPHQNEHGLVKLFSARCMQCHQQQDCGQFGISGSRITENCIDCHMPKGDDTSMEIETAQDVLFPEIRDHYIRVERDATRIVLESWKRKDN